MLDMDMLTLLVWHVFQDLTQLQVQSVLVQFPPLVGSLWRLLLPQHLVLWIPTAILQVHLFVLHVLLDPCQLLEVVHAFLGKHWHWREISHADIVLLVPLVLSKMSMVSAVDAYILVLLHVVLLIATQQFVLVDLDCQMANVWLVYLVPMPLSMEVQHVCLVQMVCQVHLVLHCASVLQQLGVKIAMLSLVMLEMLATL